MTLAEVLAATEGVTPAVEIIDARIEQFDRDTKAPRKVFDTIGDFAANAGIVSAAGRCRRTRSTCAGSARCSRRTASSKRRASPPACSPPGNGVAWLANKIAPYGESSTPATWSSQARSPVRPAAGDAFSVDYGPARHDRFQLRVRPAHAGAGSATAFRAREPDIAAKTVT